MTILTNTNYRLQTIYSIRNGDLPISYGLALEKECYSAKSKAKKSYYVISFIKYNKDEGYAEAESVGTRILNIENSEFPVYKALLEAGIKLVEAANFGDKED